MAKPAGLWNATPRRLPLPLPRPSTIERRWSPWGKLRANGQKNTRTGFCERWRALIDKLWMEESGENLFVRTEKRAQIAAGQRTQRIAHLLPLHRDAPPEPVHAADVPASCSAKSPGPGR